MRPTGPFGLFAEARSLSYATHVKSLSRHKSLALNLRNSGSDKTGQVALSNRNIHFDKDGNEIEVNSGKSYICVVDDDYYDKTTVSDQLK